MTLFYTILVYFSVMLFSYLVGSISFSKIIARHYGVDITKVGSKNAGGTNVGRSVSKKAGILTMLLDLLKCFFTLMIVFLVFNFTYKNMDIYTIPDHFVELLCSISAVFVAIGHIYPVFSHFKGGKAVACFAGYVTFISPILFLIGLISFFTLFKCFKKVSLASIFGTLITTICSAVPMILDLTVLSNPTVYDGGIYFAPNCMIHLTYITFCTFFFFFVLITIKHRSNIDRLIHGNEPDTVFKK